MRKLYHLFAILIIAIILTSAFTWPFVTKIKTYYDDQGDYPLVGWMLWYNFHSLTTGRILNQNDYFNANQFYPFPYSLAYSEHLFLPSLIFSPIYAVSNDLVLSVNLFTFLTFVLSFLSGYYICLKITKNFYSAIIGATIYTFNPITFSHFPYHLHLMNKYFLPLLFLAGFNFFDKLTIRNSFLFFMLFTLNALSSIHFQNFSLIILLLYFLTHSAFKIYYRDFRHIFNFLKFSTISLLFLPILLYFNLPYLEFSKKEGVVRSIHDNIHFSSRGIDWLFSSPNNFIYGPLTREFEALRNPKDPNGKVNLSEHTLFLNITPLIFFIFGFIYISKIIKRTNNLRQRNIFLFYILVLIFTLILMQGPRFLGFNENFGSENILFTFFYEIIPILNGTRAPARIQFILYVPFIIFTSLGSLYILTKIKRRFLVTVIILIFLLLESLTYWNFDTESEVLKYLKIKKQNLTFLKNTSTLHLPIKVPIFHEEIKYLNWSTQTEELTFNGYSGFFPIDWTDMMIKFRTINITNLNRLRAIGVDYVILHKNSVDDKFLKSNPALTELLDKNVRYQDEEIVILDLTSFQSNVSICKLDETNINFKTKSYVIKHPKQDFLQSFLKINLDNKRDCYLVNKLMNRYIKMSIHIKSHKDTIYVKLPLIINPFQKMDLDII